ncbi:MAG: sulfotransferase family 2 domain-containing protein [Pseudolabrys sp.]
MANDFFNKVDMAARTLRTGIRWAKYNKMSPPPGAFTSEMGRLLWAAPQPLIDPDKKMLVVFSQKAACTNVLVWFFHHLGHAKAAREYHYWPHEYRNYVYYFSELYRKAYDLDFSAFKVIRIIRDPYDRAVSSFRHVVRFGLVDDTLVKTLRYRTIASKGMSFSEFLDLLEETDLTTCNPHYCLQRHPIEDALPVHHLINVTAENLFARLNDVEADLGLERTDLANSSWIRRLRHHNRPGKELDAESDLYAHRLTQDQARNGPWPDYEALLTPPARERIARLYAVDIKAYLTPKSELPKAPVAPKPVEITSAAD